MSDAMWRLRWGKWVSALELSELARMPKGYGIAWWLPYSDRAYCLPIPLNLIAGAFRAWYLAWRRPCEDDPIMAAFQAGKAKGFQDGVSHGWEQGLLHAKIVREESQ